MEKVNAINAVWMLLIGGMLASTFALYNTTGGQGHASNRHFAVNIQDSLKGASPLRDLR